MPLTPTWNPDEGKRNWEMSETGMIGVRLCDHLAARRLLIILDNCEHVVEAAARLAQTVLTRCPDVTVLATAGKFSASPGR